MKMMKTSIDDDDYDFVFKMGNKNSLIRCRLLLSCFTRSKYANNKQKNELNTIVIILLIIISLIFRGCTIDYFKIYIFFFTFEYISFIVHWCIKNSAGELIFALAIHVSHIAERFGLFVMLILGEAIISIMTSHIGAFNISSVIQIIFTILTFILCFFIGRLYFDCQPNEHCIMHKSNNHALKTNIKMR
eukprot:247271_1